MKVLLADDVALTRRLVQLWLQERGHEVLCVADGLAAWETYEVLRPPLVVLDWQMPKLDGVEVCRRIRASAGGGDAFVLMATARESLDDLSLAFDAGVDDYVMKPFAPAQFRARLAIAERRLSERAGRSAGGDGSAAHPDAVHALRRELDAPLGSLVAAASRLAQHAELPDALRGDVDAVVGDAGRLAEAVARLSPAAP